MLARRPREGEVVALADVLRSSFRRSLSLYDELLGALPEPALALKLPGLPSNRVAAQLWCVVGARESYASAIRAGQWSGFSCSLDSDGARRRETVQRALARSAQGILTLLDGLESFVDARSRLCVDLLEHEAAHQGQLIRYLYALELQIPAGWKARYALD
jgi:hypothetical protein